jgi:hypothetical protein
MSSFREYLTESATKSTWGAFIKDAELGLTFAASNFNSSVEETIESIDKHGVDVNTLFVDRKLSSAKSHLMFDVLDKDGNILKTSRLDKKGTVYKYKDFYIINKGSNVMIYAIPKNR